MHTAESLGTYCRANGITSRSQLLRTSPARYAAAVRRGVLDQLFGEPAKNQYGRGAAAAQTRPDSDVPIF